MLSRAALSAMYGRNLAQFQRAPGDARALAHEGEAPVAEGLKVEEVAAMTTVARAILNMHETITRN